MVREQPLRNRPIFGLKMVYLRLVFLCMPLYFLILISSCSRQILSTQQTVYLAQGQEEKKQLTAAPVVKVSSNKNERFYQVHGKKYVILTSSKNYEEQGIASWYGRRFHKRRTASGERYNMLSMTAAHKTLPLPSYLLVTNLANGRKVIVKVNDHGPFVQNRLIDLSYAAGKKIGMIRQGIAKVNVKVIDPLEYKNLLLAQQAKKYQKWQRSKHVVYLQIGIFKHKLAAEKLQNKLKGKIISSIKIKHFASRKKLYQVQIGPIKNLVMMEHIKKKLRSAGFSIKERWI